MLRFRNPGTQFITQVQIFRELYRELKDCKDFDLDQMAQVIALGNLMTAYGYAGGQALKLSQKEQESLNSAKMNAKMYAETFRMLGWVTPSKTDASYPLVFTYIGVHIATSLHIPQKLYEQCVLGINNPTEITDNMTYNENVRIFKCILQSLKDLQNVIYKHELCLGPMSVNDISTIEYQNMIENINKIRGDYKRLRVAFKALADSLKIQETTADNCTRFPVAVLKTCNFVEDTKNKEIYPNKSLLVLKLTSHGEKVLEQISKMKDLRLSEFITYEEKKQLALIRLGIYKMLERADYDIAPIKEQIENDTILCKDVLQGKELLFSPYQTIKKDLIDKAMGFINIKQEEFNLFKKNDYENNVETERKLVQQLSLDKNVQINKELLKTPEDLKFVNRVLKMNEDGYTIKRIVDDLFKENESANQSVFYPLIATLFKIIGFNCHATTAGNNGFRWDAIIYEPEKSIPIEIKSPREEMHLSIKAIRQALENKIILLSRETFPTKREITSLAVGYYLPNERAEVCRLIEDFKSTYNINIAVIDFYTLLNTAITALIDNKSFDKEKIYKLEGIISANT